MPPPSHPTSYTSIPLSPGDVISRSIHNLAAAITRHRPWPEFVASGVFDRPESLSSAVSRAKTNLRYFTVNYSLLVAASAALSLFGSSLVSLFFVAAIVTLWLLLHFFREDPIVVFGQQVSDRVVQLVLNLASIWCVWYTRCILSLILGVGVGVMVCLVHAVFRNPEGLFLDENDAALGGLIGSDHP